MFALQRNHFFFVMVLMLFGYFAFIADAKAENKKIPSHIENLVFKNSEFSKPIIVEIPEESHRKCEDIKRTEQEEDQEYQQAKKGGFGLYIPPLVITMEDPNECIKRFLVKHNYARNDVCDVTINRPSPEVKKYSLFYYNEKIKRYIKQNTNKPEIIIAERKLKSIDYINQYEANPFGGGKTKIFAFTFTYIFDNKIPELLKITKEFHGKAKAYLDPDDGKWKLWPEGLELEDHGSSEYIELIKQ